MKAFRHSLHSVLRIRQKQQEAAQAELGLANRRLAEAAEQLHRSEDGLRKAYVVTCAPGDFVAPSSFHQREAHLLRLRNAKIARMQDVRDAEMNVKRNQERVRTARIEARKLEKHHDRERERWDIENARDERRSEDDIATTRTTAAMVR